MNDAVWTFEELSRDCDRHYCMADGKEYGECGERFCPSEKVRRMIGKPKPARTLRKHRHALRLTLEEVARRAGLSKGFLSQVENGKARLGLDTAVRLAKAMQVSLEELSGMMQRYEKQTKQFANAVSEE